VFRDVRGRGFPDRADVDDVLAWVDARPAPLPPETVGLAQAGGRVLAEDVESPVDVPAFRRASMDGWAVRGEETFGASDVEPLALLVSGEARPGLPPPGPLEKGRAARILTGAPVPDGADAVLPAEWGEEQGERLVVRGEVAPGRHVGVPGEDLRRGTLALAAGRRLRPQDLGLLSAMGHAEVEVVRRPRVAILVTGSELLPPGAPPAAYRVPDANGPMLAALVARDGGVAAAPALVPDDEAALEHALDRVTEDVCLVTGASSVGREDQVPSLVARRGEVVFHGVAMRPSSPTGVALLHGKPAFLLPGNPVSCLCAYDFFAGRLVRRLGGLAATWPYPRVRLPLLRKVTSELGRVDYLRVRVVEGGVEPLTARGAAVLSTTTRADGFVVVPKEVEGWPEGAEVEVHLYDVP
jgi:molybdopterin molybdotransferase